MKNLKYHSESIVSDFFILMKHSFIVLFIVSLLKWFKAQSKCRTAAYDTGSRPVLAASYPIVWTLNNISKKKKGEFCPVGSNQEQLKTGCSLGQKSY